ncbi:hypothetical protein [Maricaulis maris]|uniref:hypothetical protein n=1 Tax=Maricaulis maris TaxID=74318 RepID=UPI003B8CC92B
MSADPDDLDLFHHLAAQATGELENAAVQAIQFQAGSLPTTLAPLIKRIEAALVLVKAAQTIVDQNT